jgi:RND family efflux transporter MFP subunit
MNFRAAVFLLFPLLVSLAGCGRRAPAGGTGVEAASQPAPLEVKVATAEARQVERSISVTGSLVADESVNLSFEVAGTLAHVNVDFGQRAARGQALAELDQRETLLQVERSRAALAQAMARAGLKAGQEDANPDSSPAVAQARAQLEDARFKFESARKLVASGDISRERYTELEKAYHAREAACDAARDELRMQLAGIEGLRADLKLAEKRLGDTVMHAPFDGAVVAKLISPGQYIKENVAVLTFVKSSPLRLRVEVPESAVGEVRAGTELAFTTDAAPGAAFRAVVRELNPSLDAKTRSLTAEARLTNPDARLKPGMFVQVKLVVARQATTVVVPKDAIYAVAGLSKVFVVRNGTAMERKVQPGDPDGNWVEAPGIAAGEQVAVSNLGALVDGARVMSGTASR